MNITAEDRMHLLGIAESIREIQAYAGQAEWKDYSIRTDMQAAIGSHFQQIGSAAALLTDEFKDSYRDVDWDVLRGLQYANFDQELELDFHPQWHIIKEDLPIFLEQIEDLMGELEREEGIEDDLMFTGNSEDKYIVDTSSEEYLNRRSGDQLGEDLENFVLDDQDDGLINRLHVVEGEAIEGEPTMVPLGDQEIEDDSFIDKRYEDVDLMEGSSLDDYLDEDKK